MCAENPRRVSCAIKILSFQNFYKILKTNSAGRKEFFDTLEGEHIWKKKRKVASGPRPTAVAGCWRCWAWTDVFAAVKQSLQLNLQERAVPIGTALSVSKKSFLPAEQVFRTS